MMIADVKQMPKASREDVVSYMYNCFYQYGWKTTFSYLTNGPRCFLSKPLLIPKGSKPDFEKYIDYCFLLSNNFTEKDEAARYEENYGTSIYFSTVLYWLLLCSGVLNEKGLKFCQGYFNYKIKTSRPRNRAGMHAWLSYYSSVIDVTLWKENRYFALENFEVSIVKGEFPEGIKLVGFEEDKSLAKDYARKFAKDSGLTFYEWINYHKHQAELLNEAINIEQVVQPNSD